MPLSIQYSHNDDFQKWASSGLSAGYIIPVRELLPRSIFGNIAKKLDKIANLLIDNNLCFDDLLILNKYITEDGKFKKSASESYEDDISKLNKISCVIENKEIFKDLVKTSGLLSWIGAGAGWLSIIPGIGAVASGVASAAYFAVGDITSGILFLLGIPLALYGGGFAVKGIQMLLRAASRGGGYLLKMLTTGGKLGLGKTALKLMGNLKSGVISLLKKLKLNKYAKKVESWFAKTESNLSGAVKNAEKAMGSAKAGTKAIAGIDKMISKRPEKFLAILEKNPDRWKALTPLQKSMFKTNLKGKGKGFTNRLKEIEVFHKELGSAGKIMKRKRIPGGAVGGVGIGTLMMMDMADDDRSAHQLEQALEERDGNKGKSKGLLWNSLMDTSRGEYEGGNPFLEQL
ncbi:hypothetical protein CMI47_20690 [Candidatus Pacearchaeota archaeon]|jgi:hypothetical protein|nr:hypothetical protein [Candidatus Pacearchaeota archaeon]|tara:strand:+ start:5877 stop:7082 length:1206 start_codon:yes stop_codon:yes gene_type:complete